VGELKLLHAQKISKDLFSGNFIAQKANKIFLRISDIASKMVKPKEIEFQEKLLLRFPDL